MRNFIILLVAIPFIFSACAKTSGIQGEYEYEDTVYLSPLSSATLDYFKEQQEDMKYIIERKSFTIMEGEDEHQYEDISYIKEKVTEELLDEYILVEGSDFEKLFEAQEKVYRYSIMTDYDISLNYALLEVGDQLYICSVSNDKGIIWNIDKLKKSQKNE